MAGVARGRCLRRWNYGRRTRRIVAGSAAETVLGALEAGANDGPPSYFCPLEGKRRSTTNTSTEDRPLLVYLPGIDGTGHAAEPQFKRLSPNFDLRCMTVPINNRWSFEELTASVSNYLQDELNIQERSNIILLGESFGGLLACAIAADFPHLVDRLVLVNPATSFASTPWNTVGPTIAEFGRQRRELYSFVPLLLAPILGNPLRLAGLSGDMNLPDSAVALTRALTEVLPKMSILSEILPPETLEWKLELLRKGSARVNASKLSKIKHRTLVIAAGKDLLLPSKEEGKRLEKIMPRARLLELPESSHAVLQEPSVNLMEILLRNNYDLKPKWSSKRKRERKGGSSLVVELPTSLELGAGRDGALNLIRQLTSPVFLSTRSDGKIVKGLGGVPREGPVLLVGNHQTFAVDTGLLIDAFLSEQQRLVRGLAHPVVFRGGQGGEGQNNTAGGGLGTFFTRFGAVEVTGRNLYSLLRSNETVLLFPGGVREAYKRKNEEYQLWWPETPEFVRMAARCGATIVPFGATGIDDSVNMVIDTGDVLRTPFLGERIRQNSRKMPQPAARSEGDDDQVFVQPLALPNGPPQRLYFLFGQPIVLDDRDLNADEAKIVYETIKERVQEQITHLLKQREKDPYGAFYSRITYETLAKKQAPSFETK